MRSVIDENTEATAAQLSASLLRSPAAIILLLLIPIMLIQVIGVAVDGRKRYGTLEGAIMLMAASLALI